MKKKLIALLLVGSLVLSPPLSTCAAENPDNYDTAIETVEEMKDTSNDDTVNETVSGKNYYSS